MDTDYVYKTIKFLLEQKVMVEPRGVHYTDLMHAIEEDLQMALNELVAEGMLTFKKDINKRPIFYDNV